MYVRDIRTGITASEGEPMILQERPATGHVDGCNLLGPVVGNFCMDLAIRKAWDAGIGFVTAKGKWYNVTLIITSIFYILTDNKLSQNGLIIDHTFSIGSNHYGIAGWYAMQASDQGLLVCILRLNLQSNE